MPKFFQALLLVCALCAFSGPAGAADALKIETSYDTATLAPGASVEVNVLVTIRAPEVPDTVKRPPVAASLVIDKSGSMDEAKKLDYARVAGKTLVRGLGPDDLFALTVYDSKVQVLFPLGKVTDKDKLIRMIEAIQPGSATFLSGGLEEGIAQLKNVRKEGPCRVILLSDGLANNGITNPELVAAIGARARNAGVSVSTIGLGLDFSEDLMQMLAQRGGGQYYYIKDSEDLPAVFKQELSLIAASYTRDLRASFTRTDAVEDLKIYGYSSTAKDTNTAIDMSDLSSGEQRQMLLRVKVKPGESGKQDLGALHFSYTDQISGTAQNVNIPLALDVVADKEARAKAEAAKAPAIKQVREEALLMDAEETHMEAMAELQKGNVGKARSLMQAKHKELVLAAPENQKIAGKAAAIAQDEKRLDQAVRDASLQKSMSKASKSSAFMSAKGQNQSLLLQPGDKGYMVEKLQQALKAQGYSSKDPDGVYSPEVTEAVKKLQQAKSLTPDGVAGPATLKALGL